jgi:hypothetical protein
MSRPAQPRSALALIVVAALSLCLNACGSDAIAPTPPLPTGDIVSLRLYIGPWRTEVIVSGGTAAAVPLDPDPYGGGDDPTWLFVHPVPAKGTSLPSITDLEASVSPADTSALAFVRADAFSGLLYRKRRATVPVSLALVQKGTGRMVLGPYVLPFVVEP